MTRRPQRRRRHKRVPRKPFEQFLDNLTSTLLDLAGTAIFGGAAVLVGHAVGSRAKPRIELPPGLPPEVAAEWERILSAGAGAGEAPRKKRERGPQPQERRERVEDAEVVDSMPPRRPVQLVKGEDGVYRPGIG